jgi:hypothetical protein
MRNTEEKKKESGTSPARRLIAEGHIKAQCFFVGRDGASRLGPTRVEDISWH